MLFTKKDALTVANILRFAAKKEILPRFRNLSDNEIRQKTSRNDLVTDADEAAERVIEDELLKVFPSAIVIGEESASRDAKRLDRLNDAELVFLVDPVDGTLNFAAGMPLFGVVAAAVMRGEVVAGVIFDPISDDWAIAVRGEGAWIQKPDGRTEALRVASPRPLSEMTGTVSWYYLPEEMKPLVTANLWRVGTAMGFRCSAHEYRLVASGQCHFTFSSSVLPWDHAAGWLLHREAGGYTAHFDGSPYRPVNRGGGLISAPDKATWRALRDALLQPQL